MVLLVVALEDLHGVPRGHREDQDGRGHVEGVHGRVDETHHAEAPHHGEERGHEGKEQSLEGTKGFVVDQPHHEDGHGEQQLGALGVVLELGQVRGTSAHRDGHGVVTLPVDDGLDLAHDALKAGGIGIEVREDGRGAPVAGDDGVDVEGIVADGLTHRLDLWLRLRDRFHDGKHVETPRRTRDVLGPAREAEHGPSELS